MLSQADQNISQVLKKRLQAVAGNRLKAVIVFGSRAWGGASPDSDLDVAVLLTGCTLELEAALDEACYQTMWDYDFSPLISLKVFEEEDFTNHQHQGFTFYRKVAEEGISL